jgi:outer membrane scaffolding protein for murein synthesis (MipA/OmpV family)
LNSLRAALLLVCFSSGAAFAEGQPLWEAGAGVGVIRFAHYRGSNEYQTWVLPVPYVVYRGEFLKVDDRRMRGLFFRTDRSELDVSVNGAPPVRNDNARQGMPDLDATLEVGPSLNLFLLRSGDKKEVLELRLPVRTVIASDFSHFRQVGWLFQPNISFDLHDAPGFPGWKFGVMGGLIYTDRAYNRYFYAVDPVFATPERPAFSPGGGYAGTQFIASLSRRFARFWVGGFAKWDNVRDAAFEESPLVKSRNNLSSGIAMAWVFSESGAKVEASR